MNSRPQRLQPTISTIIFDWGGVLIDTPTEGIKRHCSDVLGVDGERFIKAYRQVEFDFYIDGISETRLWEKICELAEVDMPQRCSQTDNSLWFEAFSTVYNPRKEMFEIVNKLKDAGYRLGLLSNTEMPSLKFFESPIYDNFDFSVFSCTEATAKPDAKIYQIATKKAAQRAENCLFIDDKPENTAAAEKIGMRSLHFKSVEDFKNKLKKFLSI